MSSSTVASPASRPTKISIRALATLDKYPDIKIAAEVYGNGQCGQPAGTDQSATANPNIDGILNQYGTYGALQALINLNQPFMPMTGQGENGWRIAMLKDKDKWPEGRVDGDRRSFAPMP